MWLPRIDESSGICNSYSSVHAVAHELGHVLGLGHEERGCALMNGIGTWRGAQHCRQEAVWTWRCGLLEPDDINGVVKLYGGRTSTTSRGSCSAYTPIRAPLSLSAERRNDGSVGLRFGRPALPVVPLFLAALAGSQGGWAIASARNACPTAFTGAKRYAWSVRVGEQMTIADRPTQPGRHCYALWSTDPLGRPSDKPATVWITVSEPPAATPRPLRRNGVRACLEPVGQRLQLRRLSTRRVPQGLGQQPVSQPGIAGEQRTVEIGADRAPDPDAFIPGLTVVSEPGDDAAERLCTRIEPSSARVVLKTRDGPALPGHELAFEQDVADHPPLAGNGVVGEEAHTGERLALLVEIAAPEELVAAADGEQCCARVDGLLDRGTLPDEIRGDQRLLAVLAAADVEQVVLAGADLVADGDRRHLELVPAERRPPREDRDVAAVGVDVEVVGIQMPDADLHERSQYGFA